MCILLKLDYVKFGVSNLFFQSYQRNTFGSTSPPPVKEGLKILMYLTYFLNIHILALNIDMSLPLLATFDY